MISTSFGEKAEPGSSGGSRWFVSSPERGSGGRALLEGGRLAAGWSEVAGKFADREAVVWDGGAWTYAELDGHAAGLAGGLSDAGVTAGDRVGVALGERRFWPLALLAVVRAGAVYVPLDRRVPDERLRAMAADAGVAVILSDDERTAAGFGLEWVDVNRRGRVVEDVDGGDLLGLFYTSGSTGAPKGVMVGHEGVMNEAVSVAEVLGVRPGERMLQFASPGFDASLEEMLSALLAGAALVVRPEEVVEDFEAFMGFVAGHGIAVLNLPTAFWSAWCCWMREAGRVIPARVRAVVIGGERLSGKALEDWFGCGGRERRLLNTYGPTETSIVATCQVIDGGWDEAGDPPIGVPLPGYAVKLEEADGGVDGFGELWVGGIGVGPGYWNDAERTAEAFVMAGGERWYRTGDLAAWDEMGRLRFGGRVDDQLKIRGHRVEPDEVKRVMERHPGVAAAHVDAVESAGTPVLAGWVRWRGEVPAAWVDELRGHLARHLPAAAVPVLWAAVDEFLLTERGKLDRKALPEPVAVGGGGSGAAPVTAVEVRLAEIWQEVIGVAEVGRDDDFFALGGDSLMALRLFAMIAREFGVRMPMARLMGASRLSELAALLDTDAGEVREAGVPPIIPLRGGSMGGAGDGAGGEFERAPLFCIHGGDGGVLFYRGLVAGVDGGRPWLAIESPALSADGEVKVGTMEEMAARYVEAVRAKQPSGPYRLAGYSFGGVMAYEMARLLIQTGEEVEFLGMFDTENPAMDWRKYGMVERMRVFWESMDSASFSERCKQLLIRMCEGIATHLRVAEEVKKARNAGVTRPHSQMRMLQVREAHGAAMDAYVPVPLDLDVVLFKSEAADDKFEVAGDYGWGGLVRSLEIVDVPGAHLTMFEPEHAGDLAERAGDFLS
ncbi:MAG: amino acid adenylation domain-containing protein [Verrucomicrobiota bacterium JB025]|nr:amino acid adenylation domain-containing protein [Verrucomicrobiota bacterium JB025]